MAVEFTLDSRAFEQGLEVELKRIEAATKREEERLAHYVVDSADPPVDTSELKESGFVREGKDATEFGWSAGHAGFQEFGTKHMPPQPFARPAELRTVHEVRSPI
jgi:HK97 gp10 family phage protein